MQVNAKSCNTPSLGPAGFKSICNVPYQTISQIKIDLHDSTSAKFLTPVNYKYLRVHFLVHRYSFSLSVLSWKRYDLQTSYFWLSMAVHHVVIARHAEGSRSAAFSRIKGPLGTSIALLAVCAVVATYQVCLAAYSSYFCSGSYHTRSLVSCSTDAES